MLPLYSERAPRRLLPNAPAWAKGELAALLAVPLMRKPSAARWLRSEELCSFALWADAGGSDAGVPVAFTSVRWKPDLVLVAVVWPFLGFALEGGAGACAAFEAGGPAGMVAVASDLAEAGADAAAATDERPWIWSSGNIFRSQSAGCVAPAMVTSWWTGAKPTMVTSKVQRPSPRSGNT